MIVTYPGCATDGEVACTGATTWVRADRFSVGAAGPLVEVPSSRSDKNHLSFSDKFLRRRVLSVGAAPTLGFNGKENRSRVGHLHLWSHSCVDAGVEGDDPPERDRDGSPSRGSEGRWEGSGRTVCPS